MKKLEPIILGIIIGAVAMYFYFHNTISTMIDIASKYLNYFI